MPTREEIFELVLQLPLQDQLFIANALDLDQLAHIAHRSEMQDGISGDELIQELSRRSQELRAGTGRVQPVKYSEAMMQMFRERPSMRVCSGVRIHDCAQWEMEMARDYLESIVPSSGGRVESWFKRAISSIGVAPDLAYPLESFPKTCPFRRTLFSPLRYAVLSEWIGNEVFLLAFAHDGGRTYWLPRTNGDPTGQDCYTAFAQSGVGTRPATAE